MPDHKHSFGEGTCARCGKYCHLTIDHFIPKSCRMNVNEQGNYVPLCEDCNREKADRIVTPDWYIFLDDSKKSVLNRYMRYASSWIRDNTEDAEVLEYLEKVKIHR